jgi:two-component system sensor histidine kinase RegB
MPTPGEPPGESLVGIEWLPRVRWIGLGAVLLTALLAPSLSPWVAGVLVVGTATNLALAFWRQELDDRVVGGLLGLDIGLLSVLLGLSGGDSNPFVLLYLFPVVVAALFVRPAVTWALFALATAAYASLFWFAPSDLNHHDEVAMRHHLLGMFAAYVLAAGLITFAVHQVLQAKELASQRLAHARQIEERTRRLASLATLAAGASHELGSPLSTILVVARELERELVSPRHQSDLALVRAEVLRCQDIVALLSADVGAGMGEASRPIAVRELLQQATEDLPGVCIDGGPDLVQVPVELLAQVLRRLVGNARDASGPADEIAVSGRLEGDELRLVVADRGRGMTPEELDRATEPFFTTKESAGHRGLGLYFVHSVVEQLGGEVRLQSEPGRGTTVTLTLPRRSLP